MGVGSLVPISSGKGIEAREQGLEVTLSQGRVISHTSTSMANSRVAETQMHQILLEVQTRLNRFLLIKVCPIISVLDVGSSQNSSI